MQTSFKPLHALCLDIVGGNFCAGFDLGELSTLDDAEDKDFKEPAPGLGFMVRISTLPILKILSSKAQIFGNHLNHVMLVFIG